MILGDSGQEGTPAHLQSLTSGHLRIVNLSYTDQGLYTCKAVNIHGTVQSSTELTVLGRTVMVERPSTVTVVVNGTALLSCRASYSPGLELVYTWSFNDQSIDPDQDNNFQMDPLGSPLVSMLSRDNHPLIHTLFTLHGKMGPLMGDQCRLTPYSPSQITLRANGT